MAKTIELRYGRDNGVLEVWSGTTRISGTTLSIAGGSCGISNAVTSANFAKSTGNDEHLVAQVTISSEASDYRRADEFAQRWKLPNLSRLKRVLVGENGHLPFQPFWLNLGPFGNGGWEKDPRVGVDQMEKEYVFPKIEDTCRSLEEKLAGGRPGEVQFLCSLQGGCGGLSQIVLGTRLFLDDWGRAIPYSTLVAPVQTKGGQNVLTAGRMTIGYQIAEELPLVDLWFLADDSRIEQNFTGDPTIISQAILDDTICRSLVGLHQSHKYDSQAWEIRDVLRGMSEATRTKIVVPLVSIRRTPKAVRSVLNRLLRGQVGRPFDIPGKELEKLLRSALKDLENNPSNYIRAEIAKEELLNIRDRPVFVVVAGGCVTVDVAKTAFERADMPESWLLLPLPYSSHCFSVIAWLPIVGPPVCFSRLFRYRYEFHETESSQTLIPKRTRTKWAGVLRPHLQDLMNRFDICLEEGIHARESRRKRKW